MAKGLGGTRATNSSTAHGGGKKSMTSLKRENTKVTRKMNTLLEARNKELAKLEARQNFVSRGNQQNLSFEHYSKYVDVHLKIIQKYEKMLEPLQKRSREINRKILALSRQ